jgi:hypothetical protein
MTTTYTKYSSATGKIIGHVVSDNQDLLILNTQGHSYVEGHFDQDQYYVVNGQPQIKPIKPNFADLIYEFDYTTQAWVIDLEQTQKHCRMLRNTWLSVVDRINPVWYASLTAQQQQELATYRQALLDIPQQAGFPESVEWPAKPEWL